MDYYHLSCYSKVKLVKILEMEFDLCTYMCINIYMLNLVPSLVFCLPREEGKSEDGGGLIAEYQRTCTRR